MPGDSTRTRGRILEAATAEFARHGIAGARIDRIAAASGSNKALIYKYFGNKDQLFDAVFDGIVVQTMNDVPIDGHDLPGYAARLWEWYRSRPDMLRLGHWDDLERAGIGMTAPIARQAGADKTAAIEQAQADGTVGDWLPAETLLQMILQICRTGLTTETPEAHRAAVANAVRRLTSPHAPSTD
ncbi:TetR family transcriptional regulator [Kineosporia sp. J2-2]|uniref:TetR family transcriptional regulator n=1 Tax=Kineosporia corallincola TaxID=2835133 RepID=A0ABS5TQX6_9ACTN|nr:TetR family transcriptional regulator [Kineosporia corallincola]MBT0772931.1 TetR family transcriptional regulator [Kineosporia corallincola]